MHVSVSELMQRLPWFGRIVDATPVITYDDGKWHEPRVRSLRMLDSDVMAAVRQMRLTRPEPVRYAIVERDGRVSIIPDKN